VLIFHKSYVNNCKSNVYESIGKTDNFRSFDFRIPSRHEFIAKSETPEKTLISEVSRREYNLGEYTFVIV